MRKRRPRSLPETSGKSFALSLLLHAGVCGVLAGLAGDARFEAPQVAFAYEVAEMLPPVEEPTPEELVEPMPAELAEPVVVLPEIPEPEPEILPLEVEAPPDLVLPEPPAELPDELWFVRVLRRRVAAPPEPLPEPLPEPQAVAPAEPRPIDAENKAPLYPALAVRLGLTGRVVLRLRIDDEGSVLSVEVLESSGHAILDRAAKEALARWRFSGGPGITTIPVDFILKSR